MASQRLRCRTTLTAIFFAGLLSWNFLHLWSTFRHILPKTRSAEVGKKAFVSEGNAHLDVKIMTSTGSQTVRELRKEEEIALVVLACNREEYLRRTLSSLASIYTGQVRVFVSIDQDVNCVEDESLARGILDVVLNFTSDLNCSILRKPVSEPERTQPVPSTMMIAQHYFWAMEEILTERRFDALILCEDDMEFSPDFFTLFLEAKWILDHDSSVWCVSSWNDIGRWDLASDRLRLFRTDFFPGLGWMLKRDLWMSELRARWPADHWDWWMRTDTVSLNRDCIVPEVSRTRNIGSSGSTVLAGSPFFRKFIAPIAFNQEDVGTFGDLSYLLTDSQNQWLSSTLFSSHRITGPGGVSALNPPLSHLQQAISQPFHRHLLLLYTLDSYQIYADALGILPTPRSTRLGVSVLRPSSSMNGSLLLLADAREAKLLPDQDRLPPTPGVFAVAAKQSESCDDACLRHGNATCSRPDFQQLGRCSALLRLFPCERGCQGGVTGDDVPNYVSHPSKTQFYGMCLVSSALPTCAAAHWSSSRACACLPSPPPSSGSS